MSHFSVSLCVLLLRDWAVGRRLRSFAVQDYCQPKVLMAYSCRTDSALSLLLFLHLHPFAFLYFTPSLTNSLPLLLLLLLLLPFLFSLLLSSIQRSSPAIDLYVILSLLVQHGAFNIQARPNKQHTIRSLSNHCKELTLHSPPQSTSHRNFHPPPIDVSCKETLTHTR